MLDFFFRRPPGLFGVDADGSTCVAGQVVLADGPVSWVLVLLVVLVLSAADGGVLVLGGLSLCYQGSNLPTSTCNKRIEIDFSLFENISDKNFFTLQKKAMRRDLSLFAIFFGSQLGIFISLCPEMSLFTFKPAVKNV